MLVVVTKGLKKNCDVVLAAIAPPEVLNKFHYFAMSVHNKFIYSNRLIFMFLFL